MKETFGKLRKKVEDIFTEIVAERAANIEQRMPPSADLIAKALQREFGKERAKDIGFHLADWSWEAAFLVALNLFPERFTRKEIDIGVCMVIVHAPNHLAAAAKLYGQPIKDVFELGGLLEENT